MRLLEAAREKRSRKLCNCEVVVFVSDLTGLLYERAYEVVDRHRFELRAVGEEGHELRGLVLAVVC